ncbi:TIGR03943 family protein [Spirulina sp. CS-785/01]|uniref:TIGR03943 family putative permease subunit n=1 Tax=Spirulina sp. CS-785/01 TaxID=3021716 RepID=UPI00232BFB5D|nr:TIGR03943 family protein [Spirulina sp. CS-785/01]MDB9313416.1 TIGR03943 family protein [Spirulina sp. CS-785/01]
MNKLRQLIPQNEKTARIGAFYQQQIIPWLDVLALFLWGTLFIRYRFTGELRLLIHPNYFNLVLAAGLVFLAMSGMRLGHLLQNKQIQLPQGQHITLFPPGFGTGLLTLVAILAFIIPPRVLTSEVALQRGVRESLPVTQVETQTFYTDVKPEERNLVEWVRTLNAYPEPDAYSELPVDVTGFVIHLPNLPEDYLFLARFVITCCAVDASPVGFPVLLPSTRDQFPQDTWLEVQGEMMTASLDGERRLVIQATDIKKIPTPDDPYAF